jgi:hypothetical protein
VALPEASDGPDAAPATNVTSDTRSRTWGGSLQWAQRVTQAAAVHRFAVGVAADLGDTGFMQWNEPATISADRETIGTGLRTQAVDAATTTRQLGAYATDSIAIGERLAVTAAARAQAARVGIADRSGATPALDGTHRYAGNRYLRTRLYSPVLHRGGFFIFAQIGTCLLIKANRAIS